jgi:hypothetical protein
MVASMMYCVCFPLSGNGVAVGVGTVVGIVVAVAVCVASNVALGEGEGLVSSVGAQATNMLKMINSSIRFRIDKFFVIVTSISLILPVIVKQCASLQHEWLFCEDG